MKNTKSTTKTTKEKVTPISKEELVALKAKKDNAVKSYNKALKQYNTENGLKGRTIIQEIIALHKKKKTNEEIIAMGYNKHTVNTNVRLYTKGKRVAKTVVSKFLPKKDSK
jgi:hypothetical protein